MSEGDRTGSGIGYGSADADLSNRGRRLARELDVAQQARERARQAEEIEVGTPDRSSALARGFQLSSEFVASVLVGAAFGWGVDYFFPTSPWGLVLFLLFGFAAGVIGLIRSAGRPS